MAKLYFKVASDWDEVVKLRNEIAKLKQELKGMDSTQSPVAFKSLNTQLSASTQRMNELVTNAAKAGAVMEGDFKKKIFDASQSVNGFTERIIAQKAVVKDTEADVKRLGEAYRIALKRNPMSASGKLSEYTSAKKALDEDKAALFELTQEQANARLSVKKLRDEYALYKDDAKGVAETNNGIAISWKKALAVIGGVTALKAFGSELVRVRGEFQSMETAMQTLLGSKGKADKLMAQVKEYAKISPLDLKSVSAATQMMLGFNIEAEKVPRFLSAIGDVSMGDAQRFNSLTLAFSQMSAAGKLMGQDLNQMINAGFNPLSIMSEKTGKSIATLKDEMSKGAISAEMVQQAFIDATSAGGKFFNMSENASKTINGQLSMMRDAMDNAFNEMGQKSEGIIMSGIQLTTSLIENYETIGKVLVGMIATYGVYKTALITNIALTHSWTVAARADAVAKGIQTIATKAQTVAQLALNAAMKANPYVLAATLLVGAATAMWALHDSTTEAEKAQKRFNKKQEEAAKQEQEHKQKIDSLVESSRDIALADLQRGQSLAELRKEYPQIFKKYDIETIKLADILKLKREIAEEDAKRAGEKKAKELSNIEEEIKYYENLLKTLSGQQGVDGYVKKLKELRADRDVLLQENGKEISEQFISNLKNIDINEFDHYISELEKRIKGKGENGKVKLRLPIDIKGSLSGEAIYDVNSIKTMIDAAKAAKKTKEETAKAEKKAVSEWLSSYKKTYEDADKAYNDFLKSKEIMSDADRDKELKKLKDLRDTAKATYERKGGSTSSDKKEESSAAKAKKEFDKLRKEQEKYKLLLDKQGLERQRQQEDMETQLSQSKIDAMSDGFLKEYSQRELNNKKEIQALQRQKEDYIRAYIQAEKDKFDAEEELKAKRIKGYKKQTFNASTVKVNTSKYDEVIENSKTKQGIEEWQKREDAMNEYLLKYGTFSQKKEAIDKKYRAAMDKETTFGGKGVIQKEWDEALANLDLSKLKEDINWGMIFGDLTKVTKDQLNKIKKQLQEFKKSPEFQNATPEQIQVIETAINSINDALVDKGGFFGGLADSLTEYEGAVYKVKEAQEELEKALKSGDEAAIEKAKKKKSAAEQNQANAQTNVEKSKDKAISNITAVANAMTQLGSAEFSLSSFGSAVGGLVDALSESGSKIGGIIAAILSLLDEFGKDGGVEFGKNIVNNVISAIGGTIEVPFKMLGIDLGLGGANYTEYNEMVAKYDTLLDVWDQLLDKKKAYIKESYGIEATKVGQEALDLLNSERKITRELASSRLDAGASAGSHSMSYRMWKGSYDYEGTNWKDVAGNISKSLGGVDFSSMWSMLDMSSEQLEWIKINYSGLWASMDGDFRGYLDDIIQYGDTEKEILKSINEQLTQTSFDSLFDSFLNTLMDMDSSSKDFADNFEEYMRKAIFTSMFAKNYESALEEWYEAFAEANKKKDGITEDDVKNLRNRWDNIVNGALSDREAWEKIVGSSGSESSREASKKGIATASQDSIDELRGTMTNVQGHTYSINETVNRMAAGIDTIANHTVNLSCLTNIDKTMQSLLTMRDQTITHLTNIDNYTSNLVDMKSDMHSMRQDINTMLIKGLKLSKN